MTNDQKKILKNTLFWGFVLWLFGYVLGLLFFAIVPKDMIGWYIMPLGIVFMLWVLFKKIVRDSFGCYFGLGLLWTLVAVILDYLLIVRLFDSGDYYKLDVYVYYAVTFLLPIVVGWHKKLRVK